MIENLNSPVMKFDQEGLHVEINAFNTQFQIEIREDVINKNSAVLSYTRHLLTTYVPRQK